MDFIVSDILPIYAQYPSLLNANKYPHILSPLNYIKVTVDLQRPSFANFFFFAPDIAKTSI